MDGGTAGEDEACWPLGGDPDVEEKDWLSRGSIAPGGSEGFDPDDEEDDWPGRCLGAPPIAAVEGNGDDEENEAGESYVVP